MELHTLGVDGGYTQRDVTELARMLTGWTFDQRRLVRDGETFRFDAGRHDRAPRPGSGTRSRRMARAKANSRSTCWPCTRPPRATSASSWPSTSSAMRRRPSPGRAHGPTWLASQGDIRAVLKTLFSSSEFMDSAAAGAKFKTPYQFVVSAARAATRRWRMSGRW
jgi:uncharacterized protein (DUF1800 family)